ncbi:outer membrane protein assembly factor BamB family protein [Chitinophaga rhizophila]|uniref:PQQ-binding-like beta-propeller repeat protein n=1 Tax=Chitinophaga rhizophila TaxID=2866212 RepID=A0ABS7G5U1_9BACT|nr:PQQ-binding-like beta-propeller repeat protein [Chitinophaga rhizophila]MBW8683018.1 PQQ-binding-like beta-propeller repeat protein [Chitinophaga rhizophila]
MLLSTISNVTAQVHYNDIRTMVILPAYTQTQRPVESTVSQSTRDFCRNDSCFFISSSTQNRKVRHDYSAYLHFSLDAIPEGAIIDTVDLIIYLNKVKNTSSVFEQGVNLYELNSARGDQIINISDSSSSAIALVSKDDIGRAIHLQPDIVDGETWVSRKKGNFFCILAAEEAETYGYYTERIGNLPKQPKLVISYHMPANQVRQKSWPQYKYDAQHTAMLGWQTNTTATGFKLNSIITTSNGDVIKSDPLINNDQVITAYQASTPPFSRLLMLSQQGRLIREANIESLGIVKFGPFADRKGDIHCVIGQTGNTLAMLNQGGAIMPVTKTLENSAQTTAAPVIGFDGSIYLSTNNGIYAYTPQPQCKLKWVYTANKNTFGTAALDESEQTVYVYDGAGGKIIAINSLDGSTKWEASIGTTFAKDVPVPSVKGGTVCVTNGQIKGSSLFMIDAGSGRIHTSIKSTADAISQPVIGTNKVFIINNGQLQSYLLTNGSQLPTPAVTGLNPASSLVLDASEHVYIVNPEEGKQSLTLVSPGAVTFPTMTIFDANGYLTGNRLVLTPEGNLLTGNDNRLFSVHPSGFALKEKIDIPFANADEFQSEYLYRSEGAVNVAGKTVTSRQNIVIHSGTAINFSKGFSVQMGGTINCKTGF